MTKRCDFCEKTFKDGEDVMAICPVRYKEISSRIAYSLSKPDVVNYLYHPECFEEFIGELA